MMRRLLVTAAVVCGVLGFAASASAQDSVYPPPSLVIVVDDETPDPGTSFQVSLAGCEADDVVRFEFADAVVDAGCVNDVATVTFDAPDEVGAFSGVVSFVEPEASIGPFSIEVHDVDLIDDVDEGEQDSALRSFALRVVENDFDPTVPILLAFVTMSGAFTISRLPQS